MWIADDTIAVLAQILAQLTGLCNQLKNYSEICLVEKGYHSPLLYNSESGNVPKLQTSDISIEFESRMIPGWILIQNVQQFTVLRMKSAYDRCKHGERQCFFKETTA